MHSTPRHLSRARAGFTLVEVLSAALVLVVGCVGLSAAISSSAQLVGLNRERMLAHQAARGKLEELKNAPFAQVFARYDRTSADDPASGASPGADFAVAGLRAIDGDADGLAGEVLFPTVGGAGLALCEDAVDARWGMPCDLDADGAVGAGALTQPYAILPVRVRVRWRGPAGVRVLELDTALLDLAH